MNPRQITKYSAVQYGTEAVTRVKTHPRAPHRGLAGKHQRDSSHFLDQVGLARMKLATAKGIQKVHQAQEEDDAGACSDEPGCEYAHDSGLERVKGIEPSYAAWEAAVLPLNYTRVLI